MTSNLGSERIQDLREEPDSVIQQAVMELVRQHFRPEFLNRIDETILFHGLNKSQIRHIVVLQVNCIQKRLEEKHIQLDLNEASLDYLAEKGFDPIYGARP